MKGSPPLDHLLSSITALLPEQELFSYFPLCKINITHVKWITEFYAVRNLYIVTCDHQTLYHRQRYLKTVHLYSYILCTIHRWKMHSFL